MKKFSSLILLLILGFVPIYGFAQLSVRQERNLTAFTKLYGYVRYFYPGDEAQQINWDMMAVYGSGQVLNQPNDKALIAALQKLFLPVAPAIKIGTGDRPPIFNKAEITPPETENYKVVAWQRTAYDISGGYQSMRTNREDMQAANEEKGHLIFNTKVDLGKYPGQSFLLTVKEKNTEPAVIVHELRDNLKPYYLPGLSARPAKLINDTYQIADTIGSQPKTLSIGLNYNGKRFDADMHMFIYNHGQKIEVPLQWQGRDWEFYEPGTKYYALSFNDLHFTDKPLYATQADIGACVRTALVKGITCMVPLALYGDLYYTYPKTAEQVELDELKQHIAQTKADITLPDTRLGDVAISWNVFQHFFPYWSDASKTPQQLLNDALIKAYTDKNATDFFYTTKLMCAALNDGHMFYNSNDINEASAPIVLAKAEGKMVIKFVLDSALNSSISAGDVVDAVDGQGALIALKQKMQYMSGSPQCKERDALTYLLNGPMAKPVSLTLHHQGKTVSLSVNRSSPLASFRPGNFSLNPVHNGLLKDSIYYYDLSVDSAPAEIKQQLPQLLKAKAVILDMRGYPKASLLSLICQLLKHDDDSHWLYGPQYIYPDHQQVIYHPLDWKLRQAAPHIGTRIYYLIDANTQSAAESCSGYFKDFKLATIIGQPTAGANGGIAEFRLPAMNNMFYSGQLVTNHDGSKEHINGIIPDIVVKPTIKGITEGRDEILESAVAEAERLQ
jgi:C-terminal processing protease CtpA/Prc